MLGRPRPGGLAPADRQANELTLTEAIAAKPVPELRQMWCLEWVPPWGYWRKPQSPPLRPNCLAVAVPGLWLRKTWVGAGVAHLASEAPGNCINGGRCFQRNSWRRGDLARREGDIRVARRRHDAVEAELGAPSAAQCQPIKLCDA